MNNKIISLDSNDVVLFERDTFTLFRLKELIEAQVKYKWTRKTYDEDTQKANDRIYSLLDTISINSEQIDVKVIEFNTFKNCQILKVGGKGWENGELKIQVSILINCKQSMWRYRDVERDEINIYFEFSSLESIETKSPLDDLRQIIQSQ
ncbi:KGK domain-containing protein [Anabaena subtropica]|uniref:KGK domain-containing protein n=1 Tax=Anabaena subtropica FACHB-260 TaxID=2692884 RepID=A0ABR8CRI8_9NOST|nr:KGK domain-containing protein [Anabaena subtropica]MBD2345801.1 KGK domain-containing protein [Anabaena subtropica FACHB-260]